MDYMDVYGPNFANTPFCSNYINKTLNSLANESNIVQLRKKLMK